MGGGSQSDYNESLSTNWTYLELSTGTELGKNVSYTFLATKSVPGGTFPSMEGGGGGIYLYRGGSY